MLEIKDLNLLKITKVKKWEVYFDYDGEHYLLHGSSELGEGATHTLYERHLNEYGNYKLTFIKNVGAFDESVGRIYINKQKGNSVVYKLIDKKFFIRNLELKGLISVSDEYKCLLERMENIENLLKVHEHTVRTLKSELQSLKDNYLKGK